MMNRPPEPPPLMTGQPWGGTQEQWDRYSDAKKAWDEEHAGSVRGCSHDGDWNLYTESKDRPHGPPTTMMFSCSGCGIFALYHLEDHWDLVEKHAMGWEAP